MSYRVGNGFDIHKLVEGRPLILGGVTIAHHKGLLGHSDGDCATHSLIDALLGACALGDIGMHFPPDNESIKGINSLVMLKQIYSRIKADGWVLENADISIICEEPKLKPHYESMRKALANCLLVDLSQINVKARTTEKLGQIGAGDAIAAICTVLIKKL